MIIRPLFLTCLLVITLMIFNIPIGFSGGLYRDGALLMHDQSRSSSPGLEQLVFLKGVGEYYEVSAAPWIPVERYPDLFAMLEDRGINMIRIFASSGDTELQQQGWVFPFRWNSNQQKYELNQINPDYLNRLDTFLTLAESQYEQPYLPFPRGTMRTISKDHDIFILYSFFDFSMDLVTRWEFSAWNPENNTYPDSTPYEWWDMHRIFDGNHTLNELGELQKHFVQRIVTETAAHQNIMYEVINIPKCGDAALVREWTQEVIRWIRDAEGSTRHIIGVSESLIPDVTNAIFSIDDVDMIERHDAAYGMIASSISPDLDCQAREIQGLTLDRESQTLADDFYQFFSPPGDPAGMPKIRMADTDNLHRLFTGNVLTPFGRDFDQNCMRWAHVALVHGAQFNTKESIHFFENPEEQDCIRIPSGSGGLCSRWLDEPDQQPEYCANCDDFWWETPQSDTEDAFAGFDVGLASQIASIPSAKRPFVRMAGFGPNPPQTGDTLTIDVILGSIYGNPTGPDLYAYAGLWWDTPQNAYYNDLPWDYFIPIGSIFTDRVANSHSAQLSVTSDWPLNTPILFAFAGYDSGGNVSDPWPFLVSHPDTVFFSGSSDAESTRLAGTPHPAIRHAGGYPIPHHLIESWAIVPAPQRSLDPVICMAGWNYSNLQDSEATGLFQFSIILYLPGETDCNAAGILDAISIRLSCETPDDGWVNLYTPGQKLNCEFQAQGILIGAAFTADIHSPDTGLAAGAYLLEAKVVSRGVSSTIWPYLTISE